VHLPVLKLGIPTVAIRGLGVYPPTRADQYGFAAHGVVSPPVRSISEIDPDALITFFSNGWQARFQRYDASYLRPTETIVDEVRRAVGALLDRPSSPPMESCATRSS
jgi:hypothetical protein